MSSLPTDVDKSKEKETPTLAKGTAASQTAKAIAETLAARSTQQKNTSTGGVHLSSQVLAAFKNKFKDNKAAQGAATDDSKKVAPASEAKDLLADPARILALIKQDNPDDPAKLDFGKPDFKWTNTSITRQEAADSIQEAIGRFSALIIPGNAADKRALALAFLEAGISSAYELINTYTPKTFSRTFSAAFQAAGIQDYAEQAYNNALEVHSRVLLHMMNIQDASQSHYAVTPWNVSELIHSNTTAKLPDSEGLFGSDVYMTINPDDSVMSPAAYLYELKKTADKYLEVQADAVNRFDSRRPDIAQLELTRSTISDEIPKLDIVNHVLETRLQDLLNVSPSDLDGSVTTSLYENLSKQYGRPHQPFLLSFEECCQALKLLGSDIQSLWQAFRRPDAALDSSQDIRFLPVWDYYQQVFDEKQLADACGATVDSQTKSFTIDIEGLRMRQQLSYEDIDQLVTADLDLGQEKNPDQLLEQLFINRDETAPPVMIDLVGQTDQRQVLVHVTQQRANKILRLVKASKRSGLSIAQLQHVCAMVSQAETCATTDRQFFLRALPYVSFVQRLGDDPYGLTIDEALGLLGFLRDSAGADGGAALNTVFPQLLGLSWQPRSTESADLKIRYALMSSLGIRDADFTAMVTLVKKQFITAQSAAMAGDTFAGCKLRFIAAKESLPDKEKNLIVIQSQGDTFALRLFDSKGNRTDVTDTTQLTHTLIDQLSLAGMSPSTNEADNAGLIRTILSQVDNTAFLLDKEVLSAFYRVARLVSLFNITVQDLQLLLQAWSGDDDGGLSFAGPLTTPSRNFSILLSVFENYEWLAKQTWANTGVLNYLMTGQGGMNFSALKNDTATALVQVISDAISNYLVDDAHLESAVNKALTGFAAAAPDGRLLKEDKSELTAADVVAWLHELQALSATKYFGAVLQVPEHNEIDELLTAKKCSATNAELSLFLTLLSSQVRQLLAGYRQQQILVANQALAQALQIDQDQDLAGDFSRWGSYLIPAENILDIVANETVVDRQRYYFNAYKRLAFLIQTLGLSAEDLSYLLSQPSMYKADPDNSLNPWLTLSAVQVLSRLARLKAYFTDTASLFRFLNGADVNVLSTLTAWQAEDITAMAKHWGLNEPTFGKTPQPVMAMQGAGAIGLSQSRVTEHSALVPTMALGFADCNELAVLEKQGEQWETVAVLGGMRQGNLGASLALSGNRLVALDSKNHVVVVYVFDGRWKFKHAVSHSQAPVALALNSTWCCIAYDKIVEVYSAADMEQAGAKPVYTIAAPSALVDVALDQRDPSRCTFICTDNNFYMHSLGSEQSTAVGSLKDCGSSALTAGIHIASSPTSVMVSIPKDPSRLHMSIDFAKEALLPYSIDCTGHTIKGISLYNDTLYLLTDEKIMTVPIVRYNAFTDWVAAASTIYRMGQCFEMSQQLQVPVRQQIDVAQLDHTAQYEPWAHCAHNLLHLVKARHKAEEWDTVLKPFYATLAAGKRDVLVDTILQCFQSSSTYDFILTRQDLSEHLLLDVDVTGLVTTSYVREAISALQLYLHRCEMNLEAGTTIDPAFDSYWQWMRSYSTWQANRLVFLYPENYLEPELRKGRSPLFDDFNDFIKRNNANPDTIAKAYNLYLDGFLTIAHLKIVNMWVNKESDQSYTLYMIGRTTDSDGYQYYYRVVSLADNDHLNAYVPDDWGVWRKVETKIPVKWVTSAAAYGRLYIFWVEIQQYSGNDKDKINTSVLSIKCCNYNFRGKWSLPQTLVDNIESNICPRTTEERQNKLYHNLIVAAQSMSCTLVYTDISSQRVTTLQFAPQLKAKIYENIAEPDYTFLETNLPNGCLGVWDAYDRTLAKAPPIKTGCLTGDKSVGGWFRTGSQTEKEMICDINTITSEGIINISLFSDKGKLWGCAAYDIKTNGLDNGIVNYTFKPNTWYYIAFTIRSIRQMNTLVGYQMVALHLVEVQDVTGEEVYGKLIRLQSNLTVSLMHSKAVLTKSLTSLPDYLHSLAITNLQAALAKTLGQAKENETVVTFYPNQVRTIVIYDAENNVDTVSKNSGVLLENPQVFLNPSSNDVAFHGIQGSDSRHPMASVHTPDETYLVVNSHDNKQQFFYRLNSSVAARFDQVFSTHVDSVASLLSPETQHIQESSFANLRPDEAKVPRQYWPEDEFIDIYGADSVYYWELFFFVPLLIAKSCITRNDYELAKQWFEAIFDPLAKTPKDKLADPNDAYWHFIGLQTQNNPVLRYEHFGSRAFELVDEMSDDVNIKPAWDIHLPAIKKYHDDPFDPHAIARLRPIAYQRNVFKHYVDNIMNWGDQFYRQNTRETLQEAYMLYSLAADVLGKRPTSAGERPAPAPQTLGGLEQLTAAPSEFLIGMESSLAQSGRLNSSPVHNPNNDIIGAYFSVPENPAFIELWDRLDNRLYNLRHQLTLDGKPNSLPLFQPPANPMALVGAASGNGIGAPSYAAVKVDVPAYRYSTMSGKAMQFISYVDSFGSRLQSAIRSRDMEALSQMRAVQQVDILKMMDDVKKSAIDIAKAQLASANLSLAKTEYQRDYYDTLLNYGVGKKAGEVWRYSTALGLKEYGLLMTEAAAVFMTAASGTKFIEMLLAPISGLIFGFSNGGVDASGAPKASSEALNILGFAAQTQGGVAEKIAGQLEQAQQHYLRKKESTQRIEEIKQTIVSATRRLASAEQQYEIYKKRMENSQQIERFYNQKFLDQELYSWMTQRLTQLHKQAFDMAYELALECQRCWQYELGDDHTQFITGNYWNNAYRGVLAAQSLVTDLLRMDKAYYEKNERTFEIVKEVSLTELDPLAFLTLLETGSCSFSLTENLFDKDFPGHYMRRIKSVSLTVETQVSGSAKPRNINTTLTQVSNRFTLVPDIELVSFLQTGKTVSGSGELGEQQAQKLCSNICNNQQIATSTAQDDSGLFSVSFAYDSRYLPYEGTGAISDWLLDLPLAENPRLVSTVGRALSVTGFINALPMADLIRFIRHISEQSSLAGSFHNETMERLKSHTTVDDLCLFVDTMIGDPSLHHWLNDFGKANLDLMVKALEKLSQASLANKLSAYISGVDHLPASVQDAAFSDKPILNITDIIIKVSYTAKDGGLEFREKVRQLNAR